MHCASLLVLSSNRYCDFPCITMGKYTLIYTMSPLPQKCFHLYLFLHVKNYTVQLLT